MHCLLKAPAAGSGELDWRNCHEEWQEGMENRLATFPKAPRAPLLEMMTVF